MVVLALDHCILWGEDRTRLRDSVASRAAVDPARLLVIFSHSHASGLMDTSRADRPGGDLIAPYLEDRRPIRRGGDWSRPGPARAAGHALLRVREMRT